MTDTVTLLSLRNQVRQRSNMESSSFVADSEVNLYINQSMKEFYDILIDSIEDYNLSTSSFTVASSDNGIKALPSDFYKLRGLDDVTDPAHPRSVRKFNWNERNDFNTHGVILSPYDYSDVTYRIGNSSLYFQPIANASKPYTLWYYPTPTVMAGDTDTMNAINGWDEYVVIDAAIKCLIKEESDISQLAGERQKIRIRMENMKMSRDEGLPEKVSRVRNRRRAGRYPFSGEYLP